MARRRTTQSSRSRTRKPAKKKSYGARRTGLKTAVRNLEKIERQQQKEREITQATIEVAEYEEYIKMLKSLHKECSDSLDWESIRTSNPPEKPIKSTQNESIAQGKLESFTPSFFYKIFRLTKSKRKKLLKAIDDAKLKDEEIFNELC